MHGAPDILRPARAGGSLRPGDDHAQGSLHRGDELQRMQRGEPAPGRKRRRECVMGDVHDLRAVRSNTFSRLVNTAGVYGIAILFLVLGLLLQVTGAIGNFMSVQNMLNIVDAVALVGIVAVGMSFVT